MNCDNCNQELQSGWICCPACGYCSANNLQATGVGITFNLSSDFLVAKEAVDKMIEQMSSQDWELTHGDPERVAAIQALLGEAKNTSVIPVVHGPYQALVNKVGDLEEIDTAQEYPFVDEYGFWSIRRTYPPDKDDTYGSIAP